MDGRWIIIFAVDRAAVEPITALLAAEPDVTLASETDTESAAVLALEVAAEPEIVDHVTTLVRSVDVDAQRLQDVILDLVRAHPGPCDVSLDFDVVDDPEPCPHCQDWRHERVADRDGVPVLREWHRRECPVYLTWS